MKTLNKQNKKNMIKIPENLSIFYNQEKKKLTLIGFKINKTLSIQLKLIVNSYSNYIEVTSIPFNLSLRNLKKIKALQGTIKALIKQTVFEISSNIYQKLKFIGIGFKALVIQSKLNKLLLLKLGYSHELYFKIPINIKMFCLKLTKLFLFGNCFQKITQIAANIRKLKSPEPYKGKGILYESEKITLKEGKKNLKK